MEMEIRAITLKASPARATRFRPRRTAAAAPGMEAITGPSTGWGSKPIMGPALGNMELGQ